MPTTRSATRPASTKAAPSLTAETSDIAAPRKRKSKRDPQPQTKEKKSRPSTDSVLASGAEVPAAATSADASVPGPTLVPAVLTFSLDEAKAHLIRADDRFEDIFSRMECKPFLHLERVHPFRALVSSILGQQISWMAARTINHRFIRLYDPSLPEKPTDDSKSPTSFFPTPGQVAKTDPATLRTAGLSGRKSEYVRDLAARFADGRLSTEKLIQANDEELSQMLIEVKGIGRWTVDMFAMFSLRRPDILPVGDLGVQRGLVRWFLSRHSSSHSYTLSPEKVSGQSSEKKKVKSKKEKDTAKKEATSLISRNSSDGEDDETLPSFHNQGGTNSGESGTTQDISSVPAGTIGEDAAEVASLPPTFTPSIKKVLNQPSASSSTAVPSLPEGLTVAILKSRLEGKKIKGAFLTPKEMEDLTNAWRPYRSVGVYYMWSLADADA